ncbi:MAG: molybdopterin-dependent oxidoreductase, partial [Actinomycetota bacterium]
RSGSMSATSEHRRRRLPAMTAAQVNLWLAVAVLGAAATGLVSWAVGTEWARLWTALHAAFGVMVLVLTPAKTSGSVRVGLRRGRTSRWLSIAFGVLVLAVIGLGLAHSTGAWTGVGYWTSLWTHFLLAFVVLPLLLWHVLARPVRTRAVDFDRRMLLGGGMAAGVAALTVGTVELGVRLVGASGGRRRFTGSHEVGSMDPDAMPTVSWIDDRAPTDVDPAAWSFTVDGRAIDLQELAAQARPLDAVLDCTGGWWSRQAWDVIPVAEILDGDQRSFLVRSATGYHRTFPIADAGQVYLAVGYHGRALRRGHGAPLRLVAPGRRGPWWVKWVTEIESTNRPWWLQLPFPAE